MLAEAYNALGIQNQANDDLQTALICYEQSRDLYEKLNITIRLSHAIENMGIAHFHLGNLVKALGLYQEALELKQTLLHVPDLTKSHNNIAMVYKNLGNYEKALEYGTKPLPVLIANKSTFQLSLAYLNIGNIYRQLTQYDSSILYHTMALELSQSLDDTLGFGYAYYGMASAYFNKEEYALSVDSYLKAIEIFEAQNVRSLMMASYTSLSVAYRKWNNLPKATTYALKALKLSVGLEDKNTLVKLFETLYYTYKERGDMKKALEYHEQYFTYKDSLLNDQKLKDIAFLETNFEINQRDNEIELLNKANEVNEIKAISSNRMRLFLIITTVLLLALVLVLYLSYRSKKSSESNLSEKNQQLLELNAAKDKFFAIIAHDLRNPLSAFRSLSGALSENFQYLPEAELQRYLHNLRDSSEDLIDLLHNLLQWALSQTETSNLKLQELDLNELLVKNIQLFKENAQQKNIFIRTNHASKSSAYVDASTVDLVFRNLISNAIKFTEAGGDLTINTMDLPTTVKVSFEDNGIGMTEVDAKKLFSIVEDTSSIGQSKEKGTGLGLILCKEFVTKNHGEIMVKSELGKGSRFEVRLPVTKQEMIA